MFESHAETANKRTSMMEQWKRDRDKTDRDTRMKAR